MKYKDVTIGNVKEDASRRTNPNTPAFYKPVRKGLVRRLAQ